MKGYVIIALLIWGFFEFFVYWWLTYSHDRRAERRHANREVWDLWREVPWQRKVAALMLLPFTVAIALLLMVGALLLASVVSITMLLFGIVRFALTGRRPQLNGTPLDKFDAPVS